MQAACNKQLNPEPSHRRCAGELVEVNSGGLVLFCFFAAAAHLASPAQPQPSPREGCLVVKFHGNRLATQSEQFANELTRHLGVCAPACRILRKGVGPARYPCRCCGGVWGVSGRRAWGRRQAIVQAIEPVQASTPRRCGVRLLYRLLSWGTCAGIYTEALWGLWLPGGMLCERPVQVLASCAQGCMQPGTSAFRA